MGGKKLIKIKIEQIIKMNKLLSIILVLVSSVCVAQDYPYKHFVIGYGVGTNSFSNAYVSGVSPGTLPLDLTTVDFQKDRFNHSSFLLKSGYWDEMFYIDSDISYLSTVIGEGLRSLIAKNNVKKKNLAHTGKLRKIDDNIREDAEGIGKNADIIRLELGVGSDGYYLGGVWGFSTFGIEDLQNTSTGGVNGTRVHLNAEPSTCMTLGVSIAKEVNTKLGKAMIATQINSVGMRYKNVDDLKRKGLESKTLIKLYSKADPGFYADAFYRFQRFKDFERPANWNNNNNGENGIAPKIITHAIGINVGFYFSY